MRKTTAIRQNRLFVAAFLVACQSSCITKDATSPTPVAQTGDLVTDVVTATNILVSAGCLPAAAATVRVCRCPTERS